MTQIIYIRIWIDGFWNANHEKYSFLKQSLVLITCHGTLLGKWNILIVSLLVKWSGMKSITSSTVTNRKSSYYVILQFFATFENGPIRILDLLDASGTTHSCTYKYFVKLEHIILARWTIVAPCRQTFEDFAKVPSGNRSIFNRINSKVTKRWQIKSVR